MRPTIALAAISLTLTGCGLDALEGKKSDFQIAQEYRAALIIPAAVPAPIVEVTPVPAPIPPVVPVPLFTPPVQAVAPAPVIAAPVQAVAPEPALPAAPAVCVAIFRILSCDDDGSFRWL